MCFAVGIQSRKKKLEDVVGNGSRKGGSRKGEAGNGSRKGKRK
jgi:hypothetical protein